MEKCTWSKTIRNAERRGSVESLMEDRLQQIVNKWRQGLFESHNLTPDPNQGQGTKWNREA